MTVEQAEILLCLWFGVVFFHGVSVCANSDGKLWLGLFLSIPAVLMFVAFFLRLVGAY